MEGDKCLSISCCNLKALPLIFTQRKLLQVGVLKSLRSVRAMEFAGRGMEGELGSCLAFSASWQGQKLPRKGPVSDPSWTGTAQGTHLRDARQEQMMNHSL